MAKTRKRKDRIPCELPYDESTIRAQEDIAFTAYLKRKAEKEKEAEHELIEEIEEYFDDDYKEEKFPEKNRGKHSERLRLKRKNRKKRANPGLKNPWKKRKPHEHRKACIDHVCAVKARKKEAEKELRKALVEE